MRLQFGLPLIEFFFFNRPCKYRMVVLNSAVLGAATGTGLALLLAGTIVIYRYYVMRRKGREWDELDRWEETRMARKINIRVS